jgi:hypothetical protein
MAAKVTSLFGDDLEDHFYTWLVDSRYEDPRNVFSLRVSVLKISGDGLGYLTTRQAYENYHISLPFKWRERNWHWGDRIGKARDLGLFLHATGPDWNSHDGNGAFVSAIECNIFEGAVGDFLLIRGDDAEGKLIAPRLETQITDHLDEDGWPTFDTGGTSKSLERWGRVNHRFKSASWKDVTGFSGPGELVVPWAWNHLECRCMGDQILVFVNRTLVNKARNVWPNRGRVLLQCEGSEIFFRRMEIRQLL